MYDYNDIDQDMKTVEEYYEGFTIEGADKKFGQFMSYFAQNNIGSASRTIDFTGSCPSDLDPEDYRTANGPQARAKKFSGCSFPDLQTSGLFTEVNQFCDGSTIDTVGSGNWFTPIQDFPGKNGTLYHLTDGTSAFTGDRTSAYNYCKSLHPDAELWAPISDEEVAFIWYHHPAQPLKVTHKKTRGIITAHYRAVNGADDYYSTHDAFSTPTDLSYFARPFLSLNGDDSNANYYDVQTKFENSDSYNFNSGNGFFNELFITFSSTGYANFIPQTGNRYAWVCELNCNNLHPNTFTYKQYRDTMPDVSPGCGFGNDRLQTLQEASEGWHASQAGSGSYVTQNRKKRSPAPGILEDSDNVELDAELESESEFDSNLPHNRAKRDNWSSSQCFWRDPDSEFSYNVFKRKRFDCAGNKIDKSVKFYTLENQNDVFFGKDTSAYHFADFFGTRSEARTYCAETLGLEATTLWCPNSDDERYYMFVYHPLQGLINTNSSAEGFWTGLRKFEGGKTWAADDRYYCENPAQVKPNRETHSYKAWESSNPVDDKNLVIMDYYTGMLSSRTASDFDVGAVICEMNCRDWYDNFDENFPMGTDTPFVSTTSTELFTTTYKNQYLFANGAYSTNPHTNPPTQPRDSWSEPMTWIYDNTTTSGAEAEPTTTEYQAESSTGTSTVPVETSTSQVADTTTEEPPVPSPSTTEEFTTTSVQDASSTTSESLTSSTEINTSTSTLAGSTSSAQASTTSTGLDTSTSSAAAASTSSAQASTTSRGI